MRWQLNEINQLIWPSPEGIGIMDQELFDQTVAVAIEGGVITGEPMDAFRTDLAQMALDELAMMDDMMDLTGESYEPIEVEITPGGE